MSLKFINLNTVANKDGDLVVMNRNGELAIVEIPEPGRERERERYPIVYGAKLKKKDGTRVKGGELLAEWDPYTHADAHRGQRHGEVRRHHRRRHDGGARRRAYRPVDEGRHRLQGPRQASAHVDQGHQGRTARLPGSEAYARYQLPVGAHIHVTDGAASRLPAT